LLEYPFWILFAAVSRQAAFILGFLFGVLTDQLVRVLIDLLFTHTL
jgi:hypothetical protein